MKHNQRNKLFKFVIDPEEFSKNSEKDFLAYCLGATQYMPGTRKISDKIVSRKAQELTSLVMCLEDAIRDDEVTTAEENVRNELKIITRYYLEGNLAEIDIPLIFIRVRNLSHFESFLATLSEDQIFALSGFVFPKFDSKNANQFFGILSDVNEKFKVNLYGMPIFEGPTIAFTESRTLELLEIRKQIEPYRASILNLRIGGTDLSSLFGLRRSTEKTIYEILPVSQIITDIINVFGRNDSNYIISGPVWEYFSAQKKEDLSKKIIGNIKNSILNRVPIIDLAVDGLIKEVYQDKIHGVVGKTVIHPSHIKFVNSMQAVTIEEFEDAQQILNSSGGVQKSPLGNKMNETNPHKNWAFRINYLARAYGVIINEEQRIDLLKEREL